MRILTICPTKSRADMCKEMVKSFNNTKTADNTLILGLDIGDEQMSLYKDIQEHKVACKLNSTVTEVINSIYAQYPDYDYYHITNDDVLYHTPGWDSKMAYILDEYGGGVAYGNDLFQGSNHPTFPFISRNVARVTGWLQFPALNRYYGDTVWKLLADNCHCLYYLGGVIIEHRTWFAGKSPYEYDKAVYKTDSEAYGNFLPLANQYVERIKEAIKYE